MSINQVGPLSGVEPQLLQSVFPFATVDTIADQADLIIHSMPVRVRCRTCNLESDAAISKLVCGFCASGQTELVSGDQLMLERIEFRTRETQYIH